MPHSIIECTSTKLTIQRRLLHVAQYVQFVAFLHAYRDAEHNIRKNRDNILSNRCKPRHIMALVVCHRSILHAPLQLTYPGTTPVHNGSALWAGTNAECHHCREESSAWDAPTHTRTHTNARTRTWVHTQVYTSTHTCLLLQLLHVLSLPERLLVRRGLPLSLHCISRTLDIVLC